MRLARSKPWKGALAMLALVALASLGVGVVFGAGLSVWRGSAAQRAVGVLPERIAPPKSGVVTIPNHRATSKPTAHRPSQPSTSAPAVTPATPAKPRSSTGQGTPPSAPALTHPAHPAHPVHPTHPVHPVHPAHPAQPAYSARPFTVAFGQLTSLPAAPNLGVRVATIERAHPGKPAKLPKAAHGRGQLHGCGHPHG